MHSRASYPFLFDDFYFLNNFPLVNVTGRLYSLRMTGKSQNGVKIWHFALYIALLTLLFL